ncbi:major capsid protein [Apis mellifera associated microvirus 42]|nr:major capsid protein [Apis mellifera associated microvirus 42]
MKRSKHSLSNYKLLSCDMGELVPIGLTEVLPGDTIQHATSALVRASPLLAPVMHPVHVRIHHWFVPHRIIWEDWEDFITGGPDGANADVFPTITIGGGSGAAIGSLADYLGVPTGVNNIEVSALPFRAYALIWNEFYRDQDLQTELTIDLTSGADTTTNTALQHAGWEKDYFTSSRPWEQKGPAITIPLGTTAPVVTTGAVPTFSVNGVGNNEMEQVNTPVRTYINNGGGTFGDIRFGSTTGLQTDLSSASAVTVNILREALALQRFEEARARYGSRYVEYLRYLNVRSSDARLQRPEYLGGGKQTIQFSEVLQTAEGTDPVGEMRGHGISAMRTNRYRRFFEEHGYVITVMSVRPKTIYAQGLPRTWNRRVKEDFWQKELEHIGQQEVLNKEVYAAHASPNGTFGFQDRYDEYRRTESTIAGEFRSTLLDYWHMARIFSSSPALNADFVKCVPPERSFAVPSQDVLYVMANHSIQARRLVSQVGRSFIY